MTATDIKKDALAELSSRQTNGEGLRIGICYTQWNQKIMDALRTACKDELQKQGVQLKDIVLQKVPGSYELPYTAHQLIKAHNVDAVICLGCLIKGGTMHFEYICEAVTQGIMRLNIETGVPVIFGVLACLTEQQALERAGLTPDGHNHGIEWAQSAIEMALIRRETQSSTCPATRPFGAHMLFGAAVAATVLLHMFKHY